MTVEKSIAASLLWFIRDDDADATFEGKSRADLLKDWLKLVPATRRFTSVDG